MNNKDKEIKQMMNYFVWKFNPYRNFDLETAIEICYEIGEDEDYLLDLIEDYKNDGGIDYDEIDIVVIVFEDILEYVRDIIEIYADVDIKNKYDIYVYSNCMATDYAGEYNAEEIRALIRKIPKYEKDKKIMWFYNHL